MNGYVIDEDRLARLEAAVDEARSFSLEARDASRANAQTFIQVVAPKLALVDEHEVAIQQTRGAMLAMGILGSVLALGLAALPFIVR